MNPAVEPVAFFGIFAVQILNRTSAPAASSPEGSKHVHEVHDVHLQNPELDVLRVFSRDPHHALLGRPREPKSSLGTSVQLMSSVNRAGPRCRAGVALSAKKR